MIGDLLMIGGIDDCAIRLLIGSIGDREIGRMTIGEMLGLSEPTIVIPTILNSAMTRSPIEWRNRQSSNHQ